MNFNSVGQYTPATVLCWNCSKPIDGTSGLTVCLDCLRATSQLTTDIPRESVAQFCKNCERFLVPPSTWIQALPESRELLALLLKKLPLNNKNQPLRLVDASFIWTEPHSRRIKIQVTVQGEAQANTGVILEETFPVEYHVANTQCADCCRNFTVHTWRACVQLRQKVPHKRTFLFLEQIMLKHNAHAETVGIKESRDGVDFFFLNPSAAVKLIEFISNFAPIRTSKTSEMISQDTHTGSNSYKFSHAVEIAPICRDDLVILPKHIAAKMGNISRVVLCTKIQSSLTFMDPETLATGDLPGIFYWREPFGSLESKASLKEFIVLDVEFTGQMKGRYVSCDVTVARSNDMNHVFQVRSHLGALLRPGDIALGYLLVNTNFNNDGWDELNEYERPDVVLVAKHYPRKTSKHRAFKLKRLAKEHEEADMDVEKQAEDYEQFLQELEEDPELRQNVNLYKDPNYVATNDDEGPKIDISELLDDLTINE